MTTKKRIILSAIELFNRSGLAAVTTNHIAKAVLISPGNLYFHFKNKEEIIREIFSMMCKETYCMWRLDIAKDPLLLIDRNFEIFWRYRFFHREIYFSRRKDPILSKMWKTHLLRVKKKMMITYRYWEKQGWVGHLDSEQDAEFMTNVLLATSSSFLHFFESIEHSPGRKSLEKGKLYVIRLLLPWTQGELKERFEKLIR